MGCGAAAPEPEKNAKVAKGARDAKKRGVSLMKIFLRMKTA